MILSLALFQSGIRKRDTFICVFRRQTLDLALDWLDTLDHRSFSIPPPVGLYYS